MTVDDTPDVPDDGPADEPVDGPGDVPSDGPDDGLGDGPSDGSGDWVEDTPRSWITGMVVAGAVLQLAGVGAVLVLRVVDADPGDGALGSVAMATVYGLPGVMALLALRRRWPLLLAAGIVSLVLAVVPFSVHSFVFGPVGVAYLVACGRWRAPPHGTGRTAAVAAVVPALLLAALGALLWHEDPICWERHTDGTVVVHRDAASVESGSQSIGSDSDVVEAGCTSNSVVWWEAATSLALAAAALGIGVGLAGPRRVTHPVDASEG